MRDKGLVFDEMRRARRTLGMGRIVPWTEVVVGLAVLAIVLVLSTLR